MCVCLCVCVRVCVCGRNDRFKFKVKLVPLYATYPLGILPYTYTSGSPPCLGIPLVLVCNPCTSLQGKNYLFFPFCHHNGTVLCFSDSLLLLLKMLTKKFIEVNWHSDQVWDRAPPDIELNRSVVVVDVDGGGGVIIIIIVIAYYRSLFITRAVKTCPKQSLHNLHVVFL